MIADGAPKLRSDYITYLAIVAAGKNLPVLRELTTKRRRDLTGWFFILQ